MTVAYCFMAPGKLVVTRQESSQALSLNITKASQHSTKGGLLMYRTISQHLHCVEDGPSREELFASGLDDLRPKMALFSNLCPLRPWLRKDGTQENVRGGASLPAPLTLSPVKLWSTWIVFTTILPNWPIRHTDMEFNWCSGRGFLKTISSQLG